MSLFAIYRVFNRTLFDHFRTNYEQTPCISLYNEHRPHSSLEMNTPQYAHTQDSKLKKQWKNYYYSKSKEEKKINSFVLPNEAMVKL